MEAELLEKWKLAEGNGRNICKVQGCLYRSGHVISDNSKQGHIDHVQSQRKPEEVQIRKEKRESDSLRLVEQVV